MMRMSGSTPDNPMTTTPSTLPAAATNNHKAAAPPTIAGPLPAAGSASALAAGGLRTGRVPRKGWAKAGPDWFLTPLYPEDDTNQPVYQLKELAMAKPTKDEFRGYRKMEVMVDSGAAATVIPERLLPDHPVRSGEASRRGVHYLAADGGRIPNLGEIDIKFVTREGHRSNLTFQAADVSKPILSVHDLTMAGNDVSFNPAGGVIRHKKTGRQTAFRKVGGVYILEVLVAPVPDHSRGSRDVRGASAPAIPAVQSTKGADKTVRFADTKPGFTRPGRT